jgi:hypothetical protein
MVDESKVKAGAMRAVIRTDDNDEMRQRTIKQVMNVNKILGASKLKDAIEYFKSQV